MAESAIVRRARLHGGGQPSLVVTGQEADVDFGFTLKPDHTIERTLALTRQAEAAGFSYAWLFDIHVLWRDPYPLLTLMAQASSELRLGTCVTNPATREPSRDGVDPGDARRGPAGAWCWASAAAIRLGGSWASHRRRMAELEEAIVVIRELVAGRPVTYEGTELVFPWTSGWTLPVWVAGYGPMALAMIGRIADGVILQLADPDLIRWFVGQIRAASRRRPAVGQRRGPGGGAGARRIA